MTEKIFKCRRHRFDLSKRTYVMGVLNVTPDSFSDGGRFSSPSAACARALQIEREGADVMDIGGESTRPGSAGVSVKEEISRVIPVLKRLRKSLRIPISIDTTKAAVAEAALAEGASIVNDISGLRSDRRIAALCTRYRAGLIIMHIRGTPRTMQKRPYYKDLLGEIGSYLKIGVKIAAEEGVQKEQIVIDPGIGFGKTLKANLKIIESLSYFKKLGFPIMVGLSRKSFIQKLLGLAVSDRLVPTIAANAVSIYNGADILRVHDVEDAVQTARLIDAIIVAGGR